MKVENYCFVGCCIVDTVMCIYIFLYYRIIAAPLPVQNLSYTSVNASSIQLFWVLPAKGRYQFFELSYNSTVIALDNSTTDVVVTYLTAGTLHFFNIKSVSYNITSKAITLADAPTCEYRFA